MSDDLISRKALIEEKEAIEDLKFDNEKCYLQCEGCCSLVNENICTCKDAIIEKMLDELMQYREIGTVEDCREAVGKQKLEKPQDIDYDNSYFVCGNCGKVIGVLDDFATHKYCLNCGHAIDWSREDEAEPRESPDGKRLREREDFFTGSDFFRDRFMEVR